MRKPQIAYKLRTHHINMETDQQVPFEFIFEYVERDKFMKYFRLIVIIGGYLIVRSLYQGWAKNYHIKRQVERDEKEKVLKKEKEAQQEQAKVDRLNEEAEGFGWGKKTRKNIKLQQDKVEQQINEIRQRQQTAYDAAEDHDIDHLLED